MKEEKFLLWRIAKYVSKVAASVGSAGVGAVKGAGEILYNTTGLLWYSDEQIGKLEQEIDDQTERYEKVIRNKAAAIDSGIIGGVVIAEYLSSPETVPESVELAYQAAYPNLAENATFIDTVQGYDHPQALGGFLAGIKGKLFEIQYVDQLNGGILPDGYVAELAQAANQPGWDIAITGPDQGLVDILQLKASDSVNYVIESARRYPDIDIVTTDEVYSQLLLHSSAENYDIINSGISEDSLVELIETATDFGSGLSDVMNTKIPIASLALIALSAFTEEQKNIYQKSFTFGERSTKTMIALYVGGFVSSFTTWWIGLLGAVATRLLSERGKAKRMKYRRIKNIVENNERAIKRYAYLL